MTNPAPSWTTPNPSVILAPGSALNVQPFTSQQIQAIGTALVDGFLAQVLYAIAGISIGGVQPFAGLSTWADDLENQASTALSTANGAQTTATSAQSTANSNTSTLDSLLTSLFGSTTVGSTLQSSVVQPLIDAISEGFGGSTGLNFTGLQSLLSGSPTLSSLLSGLSLSNISALVTYLEDTASTASSASSAASSASSAASTVSSALSTLESDVFSGLGGTGSASSSEIESLLSSLASTASDASSDITGLITETVGSGGGGFPRTFPFQFDASATITQLEDYLQSALPASQFQQLVDGIVNNGTLGNSLSSAIQVLQNNSALQQQIQMVIDYINQSQTGTTNTGASVTAIPPALTSIPPVNVQSALSAANIGDDVTTIVNNVVNQLQGLDGGGWTQDNAAAALLATATTLGQHSAAIAMLQAQVSTATGASPGGTSATVNFSSYADSETLPGIFTVTNSGASTMGVSDGSVVWEPSGETTSTSVAVYNVTELQTNYHLVTAVFTQPTYEVFSTGPYNILIGRVNSAGTTYVYAYFYALEVVLGCVVAGVNTEFTTELFNFQSGALYALACGTEGGVNVIEALCNGAVIASWTDSAGVSQYGSGYLYPGFGMEGYYLSGGGGGWKNPGSMSQWSAADNAPPAYVGTVARMHRASTTAVTPTYTESSVEVLTSFFDTLDFATNDITASTSSGEYTVTNSGTYRITMRIAISGSTTGSFASTLQPVLYHNGSVAQWGNGVMMAYYAPLSFTPTSFGWSWTQYLAPGDSVQVGYVNDGETPNGYQFVGESTGAKTYFDIALLNPG
jgi:hypothetical protein